MKSKDNSGEDLAGLSTQERELIQYFTATEQSTVGLNDVLALQKYPRPTANKILSRLTRKGWLHRLKRGMYVIVPVSSPTAKPAIENAWPLAMQLFKPAFVSGWSAAEHWGLTEQIFNTLALVTTTPQRRAVQEIGGVKFQTKVVPKKHFFGSKVEWFGSREVQIADPSRMIIDVLDSPAFGGGGRHTIDIVRKYWGTKYFDPPQLLNYAERYGRGSIFKRLGFLAEESKAPVSEEWINICRMHMSKGITKLDPDSPAKGRIVTKWKLLVNLPL